MMPFNEGFRALEAELLVTHRPLYLNTADQAFWFAQPGIPDNITTPGIDLEYLDPLDIPGVRFSESGQHHIPREHLIPTKTSLSFSTSTESATIVKLQRATKTKKQKNTSTTEINTSTSSLSSSTALPDVTETETDIDDIISSSTIENNTSSTLSNVTALASTNKPNSIPSTATKPNFKPSLLPNPSFNLEKDIQTLHDNLNVQWTMKKYFIDIYGKNQKAVINVLATKTCDQRVKIANEYKTKYHSVSHHPPALVPFDLGFGHYVIIFHRHRPDLAQDLKKLFSYGPLRELLLSLILPMDEFYATELRDAMVGAGTDEGVLIEILCTCTNHEILNLGKTYDKMFGKKLLTDIYEETTGPFRDFMIAICKGKRNESTDTISQKKAKEYASILYQSGKAIVGTKESDFVSIFSELSYVHLNEIFKQYLKLADHEIKNAIDSEFSGDLKEALQTVVKFARGKKDEYFAYRLHHFMAGVGTANKQLIRVMITRAEKDLGDIADSFERMYGNSLRTWIQDDCSGYFREALLMLMGDI